MQFAFRFATLKTCQSRKGSYSEFVVLLLNYAFFTTRTIR